MAYKYALHRRSPPTVMEDFRRTDATFAAASQDAGRRAGGRKFGRIRARREEA